jgi:hypothetical protein
LLSTIDGQCKKRYSIRRIFPKINVNPNQSSLYKKYPDTMIRKERLGNKYEITSLNARKQTDEIRLIGELSLVKLVS